MHTRLTGPSILWLRWTVVTATATTLTLLLGGPFLPVYSSMNPRMYLLDAPLLLGGALAVIAAAQCVLLRSIIPHVIWWPIATAIGGALAWYGAAIVLFPLALLGLLPLSLLLLIGVGTGVFQALVLAQQGLGYRAGWWIAASMVGWIGLVMSMYLVSIIGSFPMAAVAGGLVYGGITASALIIFLRWAALRPG